MLLPNFRRYIANGMMQVVPKKPHQGFNKIYTIAPSGKISCENSVIKKIKKQNFHHLNNSGFLEIEFKKNKNWIDFHIHSIFFHKKITQYASDENDNGSLSFSAFSDKKKAKAHCLLFFEQYNIQPEMDSNIFLKTIAQNINLFAYDIQNKNMYLQIRVNIIYNSKEVILTFHDSNEQLINYKTLV